MPGKGKPFEKGKAPGKPKGATNKVDKAAKELFLEIMEGEVDNIKEALETVRKKDKAKYLEVLSKFMPYFIAKKVDVNLPGQTTIKVVRE
jgi:hypothetical protein